MNAPGPSPPLQSTRPLSVELAQLQDVFAGRAATLREVVSVLAGWAYELLMILFVLPFLLPVSLPGLSTPLGLAVAVIAAQLAFGRLPWLPCWLLDRQLPPEFLTKVVVVTAGVVRVLERVLRARWLVITGARWLCGLHFLVVLVAALLLALPMPIPFTNMFPGWAILLLAAGLMERDGLVVVAGYGAMIATLALFYGVEAAVAESLSVAWRWLAS